MRKLHAACMCVVHHGRCMAVIMGAWVVCCHVSMQLSKLQIQHSKSSPTTYRLQPPTPNTIVSAQVFSLTTNKPALATLPQPSVLAFEGFTLCSEVLAAMPELQAACAVSLGAGLVWPQRPDAAGADSLVRRLAAKLPSAPDVAVVVHGRCGADNLAQLLLGRWVDKPGTVHVLTSHKTLVPEAMYKVYMQREEGTSVMTQVHPCSRTPAFPPLPPHTHTAEQRTAERESLIETYKRVEKEGRLVSEALRGEAYAADAVWRLPDARALRSKAKQAMALAMQAKKMLQSLEARATDVLSGRQRLISCKQRACGRACTLCHPYICDLMRYRMCIFFTGLGVVPSGCLAGSLRRGGILTLSVAVAAACS